MPEGTPVARCVNRLTPKFGKPGAIRICQDTTKHSYMTGKPIKKSLNQVREETRAAKRMQNRGN
jgi:hypothetical protein